MRALLVTLIVVFALSCRGNLSAALRFMPEMPAPKLTAGQALELLQKSQPGNNVPVVAIEWCQPSKFTEPRISDGTEWSWLITLVDLKKKRKDTLETLPVTVMRVRDNGKVESMSGTMVDERFMPDIPAPRFTAAQALELTQKSYGKDAPIVEMEWCQPSKFGEPRISDGSQWFAPDVPDEWSWLITLVDLKKKRKDPMETLPVRVIRVRDNGEVESLIGPRA